MIKKFSDKEKSEYKVVEEGTNLVSIRKSKKPRMAGVEWVK